MIEIILDITMNYIVPNIYAKRIYFLNTIRKFTLTKLYAEQYSTISIKQQLLVRMQGAACQQRTIQSDPVGDERCGIALRESLNYANRQR